MIHTDIARGGRERKEMRKPTITKNMVAKKSTRELHYPAKAITYTTQTSSQLSIYATFFNHKERKKDKETSYVFTTWMIICKQPSWYGHCLRRENNDSLSLSVK
jgi:hypothetical protein